MPLFSRRKRSYYDLQHQLDSQYNHGLIHGPNYPVQVNPGPLHQVPTNYPIQINPGPVNQVPINQGQINQQNLNGQNTGQNNHGQNNHGQNNHGQNTDKPRDQGKDKALPPDPLEVALSGFAKAITSPTTQQQVPMYVPQMRKSASFHYSGRPSFPSIWGDPFGGTSAQFSYHETPGIWDSA